MGLLDKLTDAVTTLAGSHNLSPQLLEGVMHLFKDGKGLQGIIDAFRGQGLDELVDSWVSTGANKPLSPDQLVQTLGRDKLNEIARKAGIPVDQSPEILSKILPQVIDKVTPKGTVED